MQATAGRRGTARLSSPKSEGGHSVRTPALDEPPRIGVFLCTCRGTLGSTLDYEALGTGGAAVAHVERVEAACEDPGLAAIEQVAVEQSLNRIVVAGCPPRLYADRFEALMDEAQRKQQEFVT